MACRVTIAAVLCALIGTLGSAPTAGPSEDPPPGYGAPSLSTRDSTAAGGSPIDDLVTALDWYEGDIVAVVKGQTVVSISQSSSGTVIGNATGTYAGDYPPICDIVAAGGKIVVAGALTEIDGHPFSRIAAWNGRAWSPLGTGVNGVVAALAGYRGELIAGGQFTEAGGVRARNVARWDWDRWRPLGPGLDGVIRHFAVWNDRLIADDGANLYAWDGRSWSAIEASGGCPTGNGLVNALMAYDKWLIAAGQCRECGGVSVCAWDGASWCAIGELRGDSGPPLYESGAWDMTVYDGTLIVGGAFRDPGQNLARWDGTHWSPMGSGTDSAVCALLVNRGRLYTGGRFTTADGESASYLAVWEDSVKTPQSFKATIYDDAVYIYWVTPPDTSFRSTVVRYATDGFPSGPSQGMAVPNGADGVFVRPPGAWDGFFHTGLTRGVTYYYSAFAWFADSTYSRPAKLFVTLEDWDPPFDLYKFKAEAGDGSVTLSWQNPFDEDFKETMIRYDTAAFPLCPTEGVPIPNGNEGRFEGAPWSDSTFLHSGLRNGVTYYYSAFTFDSSGNYADPNSVSVTPRAMVRDFEAVAESLSVRLAWQNPPDSSFKETFICFGNHDYPDRPDRGIPLPNGKGGRFEGAPGEQGRFRHSGLTGGGTYYYSAFACDSVPNYAQAVRARARVRYVAPPRLSLWVDRYAAACETLNLYLGSDAQLDSASVGIRIGGDPIGRTQDNPSVWSWNPRFTSTGDSLPVVVNASDRDGNYGRMESWVSATLLSKGEAGLSRSAQRRVRLEFDPDAVSRETYVVILPCRPAFEDDRWVQLVPDGELTWSYLITPEDAIAENSAYIIFAYGGSDLDLLADPGALYIRLEDVGGIRCYTDRVAKTVSAQISHLGLFTLTVGSGYPNRFVDPDILAVEPVYPNPFTEATNLRFEIRASQRVKITIYDAVGRRIAGLADGGMRPGFHGVRWDGRDDRGEPAPSGVYLMRIENGRKSSTSKVILLR